MHLKVKGINLYNVSNVSKFWKKYFFVFCKIPILFKIAQLIVFKGSDLSRLV